MRIEEILEVGDLVAVRPLEELKEEYEDLGEIYVDGVSFVDGMKRFCGEIMEVSYRKSYKNGYVYYLKGAGLYWFSAGMLERCGSGEVFDDVSIPLAQILSDN